MVVVAAAEEEEMTAGENFPSPIQYSLCRPGGKSLASPPPWGVSAVGRGEFLALHFLLDLSPSKVWLHKAEGPVSVGNPWGRCSRQVLARRGLALRPNLKLLVSFFQRNVVPEVRLETSDRFTGD